MKLTEQQKAANKAAKSVLNKAHSARYKLVRKALDAIDTLPEVIDAEKAAEEAEKIAKSYWERIDAKEAELRQQIAQIQAKIAELRQDPESERLRKNRSAAYDLFRKTKSMAEKAVDAKFPDMVGDARYHATCWKAPEDVLRAMEEARNNVFGVTEKGN